VIAQWLGAVCMVVVGVRIATWCARKRRHAQRSSPLWWVEMDRQWDIRTDQERPDGWRRFGRRPEHRAEVIELHTHHEDDAS